MSPTQFPDNGGADECLDDVDIPPWMGERYRDAFLDLNPLLLEKLP